MWLDDSGVNVSCACVVSLGNSSQANKSMITYPSQQWLVREVLHSFEVWNVDKAGWKLVE